MKPYNFKVSAKNGSTEVYSETGSKWNGVSERCYIRIQKDSISYSIKSVEEAKLSEKFDVKNSKTIIVEDTRCLDYLMDKDEIDLAFKEYEVFEVENILESGSGYQKGDVVYLSGGSTVESYSETEDNRASFEITGVGNKGEIRMIRLKNSGRYSEIPDYHNIVLTDGKGSSAEFSVEYKSKTNRTSIRRQIVNRIVSGGKVLLFLDSAIPDNQKSGVLTVTKDKIVLESEYLGVTNDSASHEIIRDFTPNYRLPFAAPNSQNIEFVFNQAMSVLDRELKRIESRINS